MAKESLEEALKKLGEGSLEEALREESSEESNPLRDKLLNVFRNLSSRLENGGLTELKEYLFDQLKRQKIVKGGYFDNHNLIYLIDSYLQKEHFYFEVKGLKQDHYVKDSNSIPGGVIKDRDRLVKILKRIQEYVQQSEDIPLPEKKFKKFVYSQFPWLNITPLCGMEPSRKDQIYSWIARRYIERSFVKSEKDTLKEDIQKELERINLKELGDS